MKITRAQRRAILWMEKQKDVTAYRDEILATKKGYTPPLFILKNLSKKGLIVIMGGDYKCPEVWYILDRGWKERLNETSI